MTQLAAAVLFLLVNNVLGTRLELDDVGLNRFSLILSIIFGTLFFGYGFKLTPNAPVKHIITTGTGKTDNGDEENNATTQEGEKIVPSLGFLFKEGFRQVGRTCVSIHRNYGSSLKWFLLACLVNDTAYTNYVRLSVFYFENVLKMGSSQIAFVYMTVLLVAMPGAAIGSMITRRTNPITSLKLNLVIFLVVNTSCGLMLTTPEHFPRTFIWGAMLGILMG